jgi:hypothetical protein
MTTIFHITGGLGKHVLSSSVINSYKKTFPDKEIIVSSAYPDVFSRNPNISKSLNLGRHQYFYKDYIYNKDVEIFAQEPYKQTSHITKQKHLIDTWCEMIGIEKSAPPSLHINYREHEWAAKMISQYTNKPILVFQPFGGMPSEMPYCWARDIHPELAQSIVNELKNKYNILHICNSNHPTLNDCVRIDNRLPQGVLFSILNLSNKRILIDSCLQHAAFALGLPSMVVWGVTSPEQFGYNLHNNILSNINLEGHSNSYLFNYEIGGLVDECPFSSWMEMLDYEKIMENIQQIKNQ